jgi:hypothetical protein
MTRDNYIKELKRYGHSKNIISKCLEVWDLAYGEALKKGKSKQEALARAYDIRLLPCIAGEEPPEPNKITERKPVDGNDMLEKILEGTYDLNVGLFWILDRIVQIEYSEYISRNSAVYEIGSDEVFINPQKDHIDTWYKTHTQDSKAVRENIIKKYGNADYNYYPRGRVTYYVNKKKMESYYLVLIDKCFVRNKAMQNKVIAAFGLSGKVKFDTDSHYICAGCK